MTVGLCQRRGMTRCFLHMLGDLQGDISLPWETSVFRGRCLPEVDACMQGLEEEIVATVALDVLRGLEYMHAHSMLHRDVKVRALRSVVRGWRIARAVTVPGAQVAAHAF